MKNIPSSLDLKATVSSGQNPWSVLKLPGESKIRRSHTDINFTEISLLRKSDGSNLLYSPFFLKSWNYWGLFLSGQAMGFLRQARINNPFSCCIYSHGENLNDVVLYQKQEHSLLKGSYILRLDLYSNRERKINFILSSKIITNLQTLLAESIQLHQGRNQLEIPLQLDEDLENIQVGLALGEYRPLQDRGLQCKFHIPWGKLWLDLSDDDMQGIFPVLLSTLEEKNNHGMIYIVTDLESAFPAFNFYPFYLENPTEIKQLEEKLTTIKAIAEKYKGFLELVKKKDFYMLRLSLPRFMRPLDKAPFADEPICKLVLRFPLFRREDNQIDTERIKKEAHKIVISDINTYARYAAGYSDYPVEELEPSAFFPDFNSFIKPIVDELLPENATEHLTLTHQFCKKSDSDVQSVLSRIFCTVLDRSDFWVDIYFLVNNASLDLEMRRALELSWDGTFILNQKGKILDCTQNISNLFGLDANRAIYQRTIIGDLIPSLGRVFRDFIDNRYDRQSATINYQHPQKQSEMVLECILRRETEAQGHIFLTVRDITSQELQKEYLKVRDRVTRLQNKDALLKRLDKLIVNINKTGSVGALAVITINGLRELNTEGGLTAGDALLRNIADILRPHVKQAGETLYRMRDGSQFAIMFEVLPGFEELQQKIASLLDLLPVEAFTLNGKKIGLTYSLGVYFITASDQIKAADTIISKCEYALDEAKKNQHKTTVEYFRNSLYEEYRQHFDNVQFLRWAIEEDRFEPWFQPVGEIGWWLKGEDLENSFPDYTGSRLQELMSQLGFFEYCGDRFIVKAHNNTPHLDLKKAFYQGAITNDERHKLIKILNRNAYIRKIVAFESLMRLRDENNRVLTPYDFIQDAERSGQITDIEWNTLPKSLEASREWLKQYPGVRLSVNFSSKILAQPDFADHLLTILKQEKYPPEMLNLEFVEREDIEEDVTQSLIKFKQLHQLGINLYSDDFGEGTNSVHKISVFNDVISTIKISVTFVLNMCEDPVMASAVQALINTGRIFSKNVIIEGVESQTILSQLSELGPVEVQGFGLARPVPAPQSLEFLREFEELSEEERYVFPCILSKRF